MDNLNLIFDYGKYHEEILRDFSNNYGFFIIGKSGSYLYGMIDLSDNEIILVNKIKIKSKVEIDSFISFDKIKENFNQDTNALISINENRILFGLIDGKYSKGTDFYKVLKLSGKNNFIYKSKDNFINFMRKI